MSEEASSRSSSSSSSVDDEIKDEVQVDDASQDAEDIVDKRRFVIGDNASARPIILALAAQGVLRATITSGEYAISPTYLKHGVDGKIMLKGPLHMQSPGMDWPRVSKVIKWRYTDAAMKTALKQTRVVSPPTESPPSPTASPRKKKRPLEKTKNKRKRAASTGDVEWARDRATVLRLLQTLEHKVDALAHGMAIAGRARDNNDAAGETELEALARVLRGYHGAASDPDPMGKREDATRHAQDEAEMRLTNYIGALLTHVPLTLDDVEIMGSRILQEVELKTQQCFDAVVLGAVLTAVSARLNSMHFPVGKFQVTIAAWHPTSVTLVCEMRRAEVV